MKNLIQNLLQQVENELKEINKSRLRIAERVALERALAKISAVKQIIYVTSITVNS